MQLKDNTLVNDDAFVGFVLAAERIFRPGDGWLLGDVCRYAANRAALRIARHWTHRIGVPMKVDSMPAYMTLEMVVAATLDDIDTPAVLPIMPMRAGIDVFLSIQSKTWVVGLRLP